MESVTGQDKKYTVEVGSDGHVALPSDLREKIGVKEGDNLIVTLKPDNTLELVSVREVIRRTQGIYADVAQGRSLADELVAERKLGAVRE
jgi:AbrB family looped-hinge helix DNA binding protein